jgi:hypothetical protein
MNDIFAALQATLGGVYVNDFNLFGRTWQVKIEAEAADRRDLTTIWQIYVRNKSGQMVPLRSVAEAADPVGPQVITRFNNYRAITINGARRPAPPPGRAAGDGARSPPGPCRRAIPTNGPAPPIRSSRPPARPAPSSAWPCCSPISSWWRSMRAG